MENSLARLDASWAVLSAHMRGGGAEAIRAREAAALIATSRWVYRSALARAESRGCTESATGQPSIRPSPACSRRADSTVCKSCGERLHRERRHDRDRFRAPLHRVRRLRQALPG